MATRRFQLSSKFLEKLFPSVGRPSLIQHLVDGASFSKKTLPSPPPLALEGECRTMEIFFPPPFQFVEGQGPPAAMAVGTPISEQQPVGVL